MNPRRSAKGLLAGIAIVLILGLWFLLPARRPALTLPDGSRLTVVESRFQDGLEYSMTPPPWYRLVRRILPPGSRAWRFFRSQGSGRIVCGTNGTPSWFVVTRQTRLPTNGAIQLERLWIPVADGPAFEAVSDAVSMGQSGQRDQVWRLRGFPRRSATVPVQFVWKNAGGRYEASRELQLPNPVPGPHPTWTPESLPQERSAGDLRVVLRDFVTGVSREREIETPGGDYWIDRRLTRVVLDLTPVGEGTVRSVEVSDATGNRWDAQLESPGIPEAPGQRVLEFIGALWPGESVWNLRIEWARTNGFPTGSTAEVDLELPGPADWQNLDRALTVAGVPVTVVGIGGDRATLAEPFREMLVQPGVQLAMRLGPGAEGRRLTVFSSVDDRGRPVPGVEAKRGEADRQLFAFEVPPESGARRLRVTFAFADLRTLEFRAVPRRERP